LGAPQNANNAACPKLDRCKVLDVVGATGQQPQKNTEKITMAIGKARKNPKTTTAASNYFELRLIGGKWSQLATSWPAAPLIVAQLYCQL